ncbi:hypothetical protein [Pectobacterium zantedeschiae]|uniref:hypothetical protein n=1 Tax=Pectobacterium zantedeschiae TaxID=2034769 RepID=UPI00101E00FA|nr:hypothetical protein [Pectobacterium zantedeschiae]RYC38115.1 hypothetical protein DEH81_20135 [Pectobacterium zantedeschiae]
MRTFSHLNLGVQDSGLTARSALSLYPPVRHRGGAFAGGEDQQIDEQERQPQHSNAHWIAVSKEAKSNPILGLKLIKRGEPYQQAIDILSVSHRHLSHYTKRKMITAYPGWECLDTEDRNMAAFIYSSLNNDANGYHTGFNAALVALEKYVEPLTSEDFISISSSKQGE